MGDFPGIPSVGDEGGSAAALPLYGVPDWPSQAYSFTSMTGRSSAATGDSRGLVMSVSGHQRDGERQIEVTSHRAGHTPVDILQERTARHAQSMVTGRHDPGPGTQGGAELVWRSGSIAVEVPTPFAVSVFADGWAAVGAGPLSVIAVSAHKVPLDGVTLVHLPDPAIPKFRQPGPRAVRARRFPDEYLTAPQDISTTNVELSYDEGQLTGICMRRERRHGTRGPPEPRQRLRTFYGLGLSATWRLGDNYYEYPDVHSTLDGRVADQTVTLLGDFHLDDDWAIETADQRRVRRQTGQRHRRGPRGGWSNTGTVALEGNFAGTLVALVATIDNSPASRGIIRGTVKGVAISLDATRRSLNDSPTVITGSLSHRRPSCSPSWLALSSTSPK